MSDQTQPDPQGPASASTPSPALSVPLNPDGSIGTLPEPLQRLVDARIREATARAKAKVAPDPVEVEKVKTLESELETYKLRDLESRQQYEQAMKLREEREAKEREKLQAEVDRRTERLKRAVASEIKAQALAAGAREESLDELTELLGRRVTLNDELDPIAQGQDGQPLEGGIAALVASYLEAKPHHRRPTGGQSMGTTGGVARQTGSGVGPGDPIAALQREITATGRLSGEHLRKLREARAQAAS